MWGIVILFLAPLIFLYAGIPLLLAGLVWGGLFLVISSAKNPEYLNMESEPSPTATERNRSNAAILFPAFSFFHVRHFAIPCARKKSTVPVK